MDKHRDSGIAPDVKEELPEEEVEIVLSSDSEEDQVPGGEVIPGGFMADNVGIPELQHIPEEEEEVNQNLPDAENPNVQAEDDVAGDQENNEEPANANNNDNMAAQGVQGSQISTIPVFSGVAGLDGAAFADAIDQARDQYGWTEAQTAAVAKTRGGPAMTTWIRGQKAQGITFAAWATPDPVVAGEHYLRKSFMLRFGPKYTASGAVSAISDLRQRPNETAAAFMDRVQIAVDMMNYDVPEADRNPAYYQGYVRMVIAQFGGGLKEETKSKVFGVPTPPNTIADVLKAATAAEAESRPTVQNKLTINAVAEVSKESHEGKEEEEETPKDPISELSKQIGEVLAISKKRTTRSVSGRPTNFRCYGCNQPGHYRRNCPNAPSGQPSWNRGRGRGQPRFLSRRAGYQRNFGPGRARPMFQRYSQNAVEDYGGYQEQQGYEDYGDYNNLPEYDINYGSGNEYWGGQ